MSFRDGRKLWLSARTPEAGMKRWGCCGSHQESCVEAQVTIHTSAPRKLCSPPLTVSHDPGKTSPGEHRACPGCCNVTPLVCAAAGLPRILYPSLPPAWVSQSPLISCSFNPVLSGWGTDALRDLHKGAGPNPKLNPRSCANKEEKGKSLPAASGAAD